MQLGNYEIRSYVYSYVTISVPQLNSEQTSMLGDGLGDPDGNINDIAYT